MKGTKAFLLFLALILPVCIFLFLKIFGRNEFKVEPLFSDKPPLASDGCSAVSAPYVLHDSIMTQLSFGKDSLLVVVFEAINSAGSQSNRIKEELTNLSVGFLTLPVSDRHLLWKRCVFFLEESQDLVAVDAKGRIRGQYSSADRDDIDRMLTELTIILNRY